MFSLFSSFFTIPVSAKVARRDRKRVGKRLQQKRYEFGREAVGNGSEVSTEFVPSNRNPTVFSRFQVLGRRVEKG